MERTVTYGDGFSTEERVTFRTREYTERTWGGCTYRVLPVEVSIFGSNDGRAQVYMFIPDLDAAVYMGENEWDTPIAAAEPVSIVKGLATAD